MTQVATIKLPHNTEWSKQECATLAKCLNRMSAKDVAKHLPGRTVDAVRTRASMLGLRREGRRFTSFPRNENFFAHGGLRASYWAGFIAADGCVTLPFRPQISIKLHQRDHGHLSQFASDTGYSGPVRNKAPFSWVVVCAANRWIEDLDRLYSITPRKSLRLRPPHILGNDALSYVVGYIDGDGCWSREANGRLHLQIVGTKKLLSWIGGIIESAGVDGADSVAFTYQGGIYKRHWSGRRAEQIGSVLLGMDVPYMKRKWSKVEAWKP